MSDLTVAPDLLRATPGLGAARSEAEMRRTAETFEASFLSFMLKPMFEGLETDGPFGGGQGEETWRSFMIDAMAKQAAKTGGVGLADSIVAEMVRMQAGETAAAAPAPAPGAAA